MRYFLSSKSSVWPPGQAWIMRHLLPLPKVSILQINQWRAFARSIASEPAVHCNEGSDKNGTLGQRWQQHENQVLIEGIKSQQRQLEKAGRCNSGQSSKERWEEIELFCYSKGINRTAEQCRDRWKRILHAFYKIKSWESSITAGKLSFWSMKASERKLQGLPFSLDKTTFKAIDVIQSSKESKFGSTTCSSIEGVSTKSPSSSKDSFGLENLSSNNKYNTMGTEQHMHAQQQSAMITSETRDPQNTDGLQQQTDEIAPSIGNDVSLRTFEDKSSNVGKSTPEMNIPETDHRSPLLVDFIHQSITDLGGLEYDPSDPFKAEPNNSEGTRNNGHGSSEE